MKTLFLTMLMLIGILGMGQTDYLLKKFYRLSDGDTGVVYKYEYNEDLSLNNMKLLLGENVIDAYQYENDTVVTSQHPGDDYTYHYYEDSIIQVDWYGGDPDTAVIHYLDEQDRVVHTYVPEDMVIEHFYNEWDGENVSKHSFNLMGVLESFTLDYYAYRNPLYPANKYLRWNPHYGSYNYAKTHYDEEGEILRSYDVIQTTGDYPSIVMEYKDNREYELHYEYTIVTAVQEISEKNAHLISVEYFDIMGRKISKPVQGFYIERKTTDKGVISTKYFIQ